MSPEGLAVVGTVETMTLTWLDVPLSTLLELWAREKGDLSWAHPDEMLNRKDGPPLCLVEISGQTVVLELFSALFAAHNDAGLHPGDVDTVVMHWNMSGRGLVRVKSASGASTEERYEVFDAEAKRRLLDMWSSATNLPFEEAWLTQPMPCLTWHQPPVESGATYGLLAAADAALHRALVRAPEARRWAGFRTVLLALLPWIPAEAHGTIGAMAREDEHNEARWSACADLLAPYLDDLKGPRPHDALLAVWALCQPPNTTAQADERAEVNRWDGLVFAADALGPLWRGLRQQLLALLID